MSLSGNTKKVAEAIFQEIQDEKEIKELGEVENFEGYDIAFVGFPVHRFGPPDKVKNLLEKQEPRSFHNTCIAQGHGNA